MEDFVQEKVADWVKDVENLSVIAEFQPQAAYAVFTHSLVSSWNYIMCTISKYSFHSPAHNNADMQDQPLDLIVRLSD